MLVTTVEHLPDRQYEIGQLFTVTNVRAANVMRDIRENIRNLVGGKMTHYENLLQEAVDEAIEQLASKAKEAGYDGVLGLRIAHPTVVEGGVELLVYGSGFRYLDQ